MYNTCYTVIKSSSEFEKDVLLSQITFPYEHISQRKLQREGYCKNIVLADKWTVFYLTAGGKNWCPYKYMMKGQKIWVLFTIWPCAKEAELVDTQPKMSRISNFLQNLFLLTCYGVLLSHCFWDWQIPCSTVLSCVYWSPWAFFQHILFSSNSIPQSACSSLLFSVLFCTEPSTQKLYKGVYHDTQGC